MSRLDSTTTGIYRIRRRYVTITLATDLRNLGPFETSGSVVSGSPGPGRTPRMQASKIEIRLCRLEFLDGTHRRTTPSVERRRERERLETLDFLCRRHLGKTVDL